MTIVLYWMCFIINQWACTNKWASEHHSVGHGDSGTAKWSDKNTFLFGHFLLTIIFKFWIPLGDSWITENKVPWSENLVLIPWCILLLNIIYHVCVACDAGIHTCVVNLVMLTGYFILKFQYKFIFQVSCFHNLQWARMNPLWPNTATCVYYKGLQLDLFRHIITMSKTLCESGKFSLLCKEKLLTDEHSI